MKISILLASMAFIVLAATAYADNKAPTSTAAYKEANMKMHENMSIKYTGDADADFVAGMIPHHQGAIDMAEVELQYGKDPEIRKLAQGVVDAQKAEIAQMQKWQAEHLKP